MTSMLRLLIFQKVQKLLLVLNSYPVLRYFNFVEKAITVTLNQINNSFDFLFVVAGLQIKKFGGHTLGSTDEILVAKQNSCNF